MRCYIVLPSSCRLGFNGVWRVALPNLWIFGGQGQMLLGKAGIRAFCTIVAIVTFMVATGSAADDPQSDMQILLMSSDGKNWGR